jgi:hypothetical protein
LVLRLCVNLQDYSAACALAGVPKPVWDEQMKQWRLYWEESNWDAFLSVAIAFGIIGERPETYAMKPPHKKGYTVLPEYTFTDH